MRAQDQKAASGGNLVKHEYLCESPDEARSFQDMFRGYLRLREQARKNGEVALS